MTPRWNICFCISSLAISLLTVAPCLAQSRNQQKANVETVDSVPFFNGLAVSADVAGLVQYAVSDYGQLEGALRVNLHDTYFPVMEMGLGLASHDDDVTRISYESSALYWRLGADYNLMKNKHDDYRIYGGLRYAFSYFSYDLSHPGLTDPVWGGEADYGAQGVKCNYHWAEAVAGIDAKVWGPVRMGWTVRYRKRLSHNDGGLGKVWYVPGFGKSGGTRLGFTFNVGVSI